MKKQDRKWAVLPEGLCIGLFKQIIFKVFAQSHEDLRLVKLDRNRKGW